MVLKHDNMISSHFSKIQIKTIPVKLAKIQTLTIYLLLMRLWGNRHSYLLMKVQNGNTPLEGNLAKSIKITYVFPL